MIYPNFKFYDHAPCGFSSRGHIAEEKQIIVPSTSVDSSRSYFRYSKDILVYRKKNRSLKGYQGSCYSDFIPIDIDCKSNLSEALRILQDFIKFITSEYDVPREVLRCYFSGNRGFHLELPTNLLGDVEPSSMLPRYFKSFILSFGDWGFDMSMYNSRQLYRIVNTINNKSGLYKISLTVDEVFDLSIEEILELAKSSRQELDPVDYEKVQANPGLSERWENVITDQLVPWKQNSSNQLRDFDFLAKGIIEGERNVTTFNNACKLKKKGKRLADAIDLLLLWNMQNCPPLSDREVKQTVRSAYKYKISDKISVGFLEYIRNVIYCHELTIIQLIVLIILLIRVDTKPKQVLFNDHMYYLNPGEVLFSYRKTPRDWPELFTRDQFRNAMDGLERKGFIEKWSLGGKRGSMAKIIGLDFDTKIDTVKGVEPNINNSSLLNPDFHQFNC